MPTISLIKDQYHHLEGTRPRTTFLGSLQTDKSILSRIAQMEYDLVLCTSESFYNSIGTPKPVFKTLALQRKISLIAIDEAHLVSSWNSFHYSIGSVFFVIVHPCSPAYGFVKRLNKQFPGVPLMATTATATPHILADLKLLLGGNPVCVISSVNKANITSHVKELINATQKLIKKAYPHVNGLQDTQASCTALPDGDFVQILHVNNSHRLTISTINCLPGRVNIYDSFVGKNVTLDTKVQIARLLHTPLPEITLHVMNIEQQNNGSDCGLYVIATTTASWHREKMRPHLKIFPKNEREIEEQETLKTEKTKLYCSCRQPECRSEKKVLCCSCGEWYHQRCEGNPNTALSKNILWTCSTSLA